MIRISGPRTFGLEWRLLLLAVLYGIGRALRSGSRPLPWLADHLADLVCLPLILGALLLVRRRSALSAAWTLPSGQVWLAAILFSGYFELLLPRWHPSATADPWDAVMYFAGAAVFQLWINRPRSVRGIREPMNYRRPHGNL